MKVGYHFEITVFLRNPEKVISILILFVDKNAWILIYYFELTKHTHIQNQSGILY